MKLIYPVKFKDCKEHIYFNYQNNLITVKSVLWLEIVMKKVIHTNMSQIHNIRREI